LSKVIFTLKLNAIVATKALVGLNAAALLNPYTALAAGAATLAIAIHNAAQEQKRLNNLLREGGVAAIDKQIAETESKLFAAEKRLETGNEGDILYNIPGAGPFTDSRFQDENRVTAYGATISKLRQARERAVYDATQGAGLSDNLLRRFSYGTPDIDIPKTGGGGGGAAKAPRGPKDISDLQLQLNLARRIAGRTDATFEQRRRALFLEREAAVLKSEELTANKQIDAIHAAHEKFRVGMLKIETEITNQNKEQVKQAQALNDARMQLRDQLGLLSPEERVKAAQKSFKQQFPDATPEDLDLIRQSIDPTIFEQGTARIREMREELAQLVNPINVVANAGAAIGTAFTDSFRSVIDGSATTQEALASFFKNIGNFFLDMAAQIIQKMITMYILNTVVGLLPGLRGGSSNLSGLDTSIAGGMSKVNPSNFVAGPFSSFGRAADGAYFSDGIAKFARGGIVNKPTMFAYADGGAGRFGLMGEQGAEAILPLRRGPGGKLGVESSGGVGNVTVNVDASGSSVEGDSAQAGQLGKMLGAAVQAELIKQKRPGGVLAG